MRDEKGKRPRINCRTAVTVVDPEEYIINCSSQKAKKIGEIKENLIIHFILGSITETENNMEKMMAEPEKILKSMLLKIFYEKHFRI